MNTEANKRRAGERAAATVDDGAVVGLGSGSTAATAIRALGHRVGEGLRVTGVPTSYQAHGVAKESGVPLADPADVDGIDVAIDGADQVADGDLIKGGGGSHAREKLLAAAADRFLVVVDESKLATRLDRPIPVEVLPAARSLLRHDIERLGGEATLRAASGKSGPVVTDNGNLVLDADFGELADPAAVATDLTTLPGLIEHGLFLDMADAIYVGNDSGVEVLTPD